MLLAPILRHLYLGLDEVEKLLQMWLEKIARSEQAYLSQRDEASPFTDLCLFLVSLSLVHEPEDREHGTPELLVVVLEFRQVLRELRQELHALSSHKQGLTAIYKLQNLDNDLLFVLLQQKLNRVRGCEEGYLQ